MISAAKHALKHKRITQMPVIDLPTVQSTGQDDEVAYYSREELARLFAAAEVQGGEIEHFVKLLYLTGARRGSLEGLRRGQVQWEQRRILLQAPGKVATKKRQPIVPILRAMIEPLQALWNASPNDRLFVRSDFYAPYRTLCESVGLVDRANPHCMRHTRITHLLMDGKSLYDVAKLVGDTTGTIEKVYGHHSASYLADLLD